MIHKSQLTSNGGIIRAIGDNHDCWRIGQEFPVEWNDEAKQWYITCNQRIPHCLNLDDEWLSFASDFEIVVGINPTNGNQVVNPT